MNEQVLEQMLKTTLETADRLKDDFSIHIVDTSSDQLRQKPQRTSEVVADLAIEAIENQLREEILCLPRTEVRRVFGSAVCLPNSEAQDLLNSFARGGKFLPRDEVEGDVSLVQALPVVVVRNRSGDVLRLRRKETNTSNPLHEKLVIWAGGHVRVEDGANGEAILRGAIREVQEELRLSIEPGELRLMGALFVPDGERTSKHAAIVYEWRAETDDVVVALSNAEFFEPLLENWGQEVRLVRNGQAAHHGERSAI